MCTARTSPKWRFPFPLASRLLQFRHWCSAWLLLAACGWCASARAVDDGLPSVSDDPSSSAKLASTQALVEQLDAPKFSVRRRAFQQLWEMGDAAIPTLEQALNRESERQIIDSVNTLLVLNRLEVRSADKSIGTLVDVLTNLSAARLLELCQLGEWSLASELLKNSETLRTEIKQDYDQFLLNNIIEAALKQGSLELAWPIITTAGTAETTAWLSERLNLANPLLNANDRELEAVRLYFAGEVEQALQLTQMPNRLVPMTTRSFTWDALADERFQNALLGPRSTIATSASRAVLFELSGDLETSNELWDEILPPAAELSDDAPGLDAPSQQALRLLREQGDPLRGNTATLNQLMVALLMSGRVEPVERYLEEHNSAWAYSFHAASSDYEKAFRQLGLDLELSEFDQWLEVQEQLIPTMLGGGNGMEPNPSIEAARFASALMGLGEAEKAERIVRLMAEIAKKNPKLATIIWQENIVRWLGRHESRAMCMRIAIEYFPTMAIDCQEAVLDGLFPEFESVAAALYLTAPVAAVDREQASAWQLLEHLYTWDREYFGSREDEVISGWLRLARQRLTPDRLSGEALSVLGKTAIGFGKDQLALELLAVDLTELQGPAESEEPPMQNLHWLTAAEIHLRRLEPDKALPLLSPLRENGYGYQPAMVEEVRALRQLGQFEQAEQLDKSRWVRMIHNPWYYGANLSEAGRYYSKQERYEQAMEYAEPAFLFAETSGRFLYWAMSEYATAAEELDNHELSANVLRGALIESLQPYSPFLQFLISNGYVSSLRYAISKERLCRAAACVRRGELEEARRHLLITRKLQPLDIEAVIQCYPGLVAQGEGEFAEELFAQYEEALKQQIQQWPRDSTSLNNLAWMYSQCDRKLEEGLELARQAVELAPHSPVYLDTLAELQFRNGQVAEAIESMRGCVKLDPRDRHYRENLLRFRRGGP